MPSFPTFSLFLAEGGHLFALLLSMPETLGLLLFGAAMTETAVLLRGFLSRRDAVRRKEGE
jgi:hypothetical protein